MILSEKKKYLQVGLAECSHKNSMQNVLSNCLIIYTVKGLSVFSSTWSVCVVYVHMFSLVPVLVQFGLESSQVTFLLMA